MANLDKQPALSVEDKVGLYFTGQRIINADFINW